MAWEEGAASRVTDLLLKKNDSNFAIIGEEPEYVRVFIWQTVYEVLRTYAGLAKSEVK